MNTSSINLIKYWRACVSDSTLGKGIISTSDKAKMFEIPKDAISDGCVQAAVVKKAFADEAKGLQFVSVRLWPMLLRRKTSHGTAQLGGMPEYVAPICTDALLARDGKIIPQRTVVPRDMLEPVQFGAFSVGSVAQLDDFLTKSPFQDGATWQEYREYCGQMLKEVCNGWPGTDTEYQRTDYGLLQTANAADGTVSNILKLYDHILRDAPDAQLLSTFAQTKTGTPKPLSNERSMLSKRLGHSNNKFPLSVEQADVSAHLNLAEDADILAVNGPPGTGKTTLLLSIVADQWIRAAIKGEDPPVIVAASTNNQAVTNIIDAFGKDFGTGEGPFAGRWLPDIKSFGLYLPAFSKEQEAKQKYQTESFFQEIETETYVHKAQAAFLDAVQEALPDLTDPDPERVAKRLREMIIAGASRLESADKAHAQLVDAQAVVTVELGDKPENAVAERQLTFDACDQTRNQSQCLRDNWDRYLADESIFFSLFRFLPPVTKKRLIKAKLFLKDAGAPTLDSVQSVSQIDMSLRNDLREKNDQADKASKALHRGQDLLAQAEEAKSSWTTACNDAVGQSLDADDMTTCNQLADVNLRFELFLLATHYWEARWLAEVLPNVADIEAKKGKTGRANLIPRRYRSMMLAPCAVSTFATLPSKFAASKYSGSGGFEADHLYDFIDLLIVDEAGQVQPELAAASFALAKKAIVIGDTQQIEPISALTRPIDVGNLVTADILPKDCPQSDVDSIDVSGVSSTRGSVMKVAQNACHYHPHQSFERGFYLFDHHRCYDEIISYSNDLCYQGSLRLKRGPKAGDAAVQPMGYLHVDGRGEPYLGSRRNLAEAQTIAAWLGKKRRKLEHAYGKPLEDIVGVVTPFGRQKYEIEEACKEQGINTETKGGMTIGTVHALQGAERPLVIFSPVYSKHADGMFIDQSNSMLNVAVSRAKDSFLVFGDMDVLSTARAGSPRNQLAAHLFADPANELQFDQVSRADLAALDAEITMLRDAEQHDAFLLKTLRSGARKVDIVSPWIVPNTMQATGILQAIKNAAQQGSEIDVFVDPSLNTASQLQAAADMLSGTNVGLRMVKQLHSKIVMADNALLSIGSFNWLSADRTGKYARHETSFVYAGPQINDEIETIKQSLLQREEAT